MTQQDRIKELANRAFRVGITPLVLAYRAECALVPESRREPIFQAWSQALSLVPGYAGQYVRRAFYRAVLEVCSDRTCIQWGTIFSSRLATIDDGVYIGARCTIGRVRLARDVTLGSNVDILSGKYQHYFDDLETPIQEQGGRYETVTIGENSWIGNGAIVMADVGARTIVAAGSVVVHPVPAECIVAGNPARIIRRRRDEPTVEVRSVEKPS